MLNDVGPPAGLWYLRTDTFDPNLSVGETVSYEMRLVGQGGKLFIQARCEEKYFPIRALLSGFSG